LPKAADLILEHLNLHQFVRQEQRRRGSARDQIDVDYWVLTAYGKEIVLALKRAENKPDVSGKGT
jgi:hypothetical protein